MDFDDLLMHDGQRSSSRATTCSPAYQERFTHILVDEYQDTNRAQNELVMLLGAEHGNVCVVGDSDQSIYRLRGADIRNILEFEEAFPDATVVLLEQNYRSTQTILDAANAVIANNAGARPEDLFTDGEPGEPDHAATGPRTSTTRRPGWRRDRPAAARRGPRATGDVAVFYRTNAQSRVLEEALVRAGHPLQGDRRAPASTTAGRSRTSSPTCGCWPTPPTRSRPAGSSTCPKRGIGRDLGRPPRPPGPRPSGSSLRRGPRPARPRPG